MSRKMAKGSVLVVVALCVVMAAGLMLGCDTDGDSWTDDHVLNPNLRGTWVYAYSYTYAGVEYSGEDIYTITDTTVTDPYGTTSGSIQYVHHFDKGKTAGFLIIKRNSDNKFDAVYYKNLTSTSVIIGNAYDTTKDWQTESTDSAVTDLETAKTRFKDRTKYGGDLSQAQASTKK